MTCNVCRRLFGKNRSMYPVTELPPTPPPPPPVPDVVTRTPAPGGGGGRTRQSAVFGGPSGATTDVTSADIQTPRISKDEASRRLIREALAANDFLRNLEEPQTAAVVDAMYERRLEAGSYVIEEGEVGSHLYVSAEGVFEVLKGGKPEGRFQQGQAFGEIAILYNTRRQASVRVLTRARVWVLDRRVFQQVMMRTGLRKREDHVRFLSSVPLLKDLGDSGLAQLADLLRTEFFPPGRAVVREGDAGDVFYIISGGSVKVTRKADPSSELVLTRGDYFGEKALLRGDARRQATVTALHPGVEVLSLQREHFQRLLGALEEWRDWEKPAPRPSAEVGGRIDVPLVDVELEELETVATLGVGGFGRVELVRSRKPGHEDRVWALKALKKAHVVEQRQQEHALGEKAAMAACRNCPHVARLERTFRDAKYVYLLMEACLGGDVFTQLQRRHLLEERAARFVAASVLEALDFVHARGFVYRDLKPENLLLDARGYVKLVDFGFAKRLAPGAKTWTFAGTPEYVAPEVVLNKGHDRAVDLWALGVLVHELLTGRPPFRGADHMKTYNLILKGVEAVHFPGHVTKHAQNLIRRLCRAVPTERLGYQKEGMDAVREHRWFQGFDWSALRDGTLKAPIVPTVKSPVDVSNFDKYSKSKDVPPDEFSGWDKDF